MNRIDQLFQHKKEHILSVYFTAGYPALNDTVTVIKALEKEGVELIEIGVPFSDPMADGPVIQASGAKALQNGMSVKTLFTQLAAIRPSVSIRSSPCALPIQIRPRWSSSTLRAYSPLSPSLLP